MHIKFLDFWHYKKISKIYNIIPFGHHCLPRIITTLNKFKPTKEFGEKSYPFDLCFSDFSSNVKFLENEFANFYDEMEFDDNKKCWMNKKYNLILNHDNQSFEVLKERYDKRIANLYSALNDNERHIYFLIATYKIINNNDMEFFLDLINKYRSLESYSVIIINQSDVRFDFNLKKKIDVIDFTDDVLFPEMVKRGDWVRELKKMKTRSAKKFNRRIKSELSKIIK